MLKCRYQSVMLGLLSFDYVRKDAFDRPVAATVDMDLPVYDGA